MRSKSEELAKQRCLQCLYFSRRLRSQLCPWRCSLRKSPFMCNLIFFPSPCLFSDFPVGITTFRGGQCPLLVEPGPVNVCWKDLAVSPKPCANFTAVPSPFTRNSSCSVIFAKVAPARYEWLELRCDIFVGSPGQPSRTLTWNPDLRKPHHFPLGHLQIGSPDLQNQKSGFDSIAIICWLISTNSLKGHL